MAVISTLPDDILRRFFDYLEFCDQLRLLAVNSRCRAVGLEHPFYWKRLDLNLDGLSESALQGATDQLFKRLTYAGQRYVEVSLNWSDPRHVVDCILSHISHMVLLKFTGVDIHIGQTVLDALNQSAAPVLRQLSLLFNGTQNGMPITDLDRRPCLGSDLFKSTAPSLEILELENVDLPADFPKALSALTSLNNSVKIGPIQELPFFLEHCRHLSVLELVGQITFCPELRNAEAHEWRQLRLLLMMSYAAPESELFPWHAWARIPSLVASFVGEDVATAALNHLSGPLRLLAHIDKCSKQAIWKETFRLAATTDDHDNDDLRASAAAGAPSWRVLAGPVPRPGSARDLQLAGGLLAVTACAARFVRLTLPLSDWNRVGMQISRWPALQGLRIMLRAGLVRFSSALAPVECPALGRVLLSPEDAAFPARVILNEFAAFSAVAIRGAALPMDLTCETGVWRARIPPDETFNRVFRGPRLPWSADTAEGPSAVTSA